MFPLILIIVYGLLFKAPLLNAPVDEKGPSLEESYVENLIGSVQQSIPEEITLDLATAIRSSFLSQLIKRFGKGPGYNLQDNKKFLDIISEGKDLKPKADEILQATWLKCAMGPKISDYETAYSLINNAISRFVFMLQHRTGITLSDLETGDFGYIREDCSDRRFKEILTIAKKLLSVRLSNSYTEASENCSLKLSLWHLDYFKGQCAQAVIEEILKTIFKPTNIEELDEIMTHGTHNSSIPEDLWKQFREIRESQAALQFKFAISPLDFEPSGLLKNMQSKLRAKLKEKFCITNDELIENILAHMHYLLAPIWQLKEMDGVWLSKHAHKTIAIILEYCSLKYGSGEEYKSVKNMIEGIFSTRPTREQSEFENEVTGITLQFQRQLLSYSGLEDHVREDVMDLFRFLFNRQSLVKLKKKSQPFLYLIKKKNII